LVALKMQPNPALKRVYIKARSPLAFTFSPPLARRREWAKKEIT